jgi:hypothetical protein
MAKETKAQREVRESEERGRSLVEQCRNYPVRLMALLQRAQNCNFELAVDGMYFRVYDRDDRDYDVYVVGLEFSTDDDWNLDNLEFVVREKEDAAREQERKRLARQTALNKLTTEERALLNLL